MSLKLNSSGGGSVTLDTPSTASTFTLTVPAITGTAVVTGSTATVSQAMLASGVAGNGPAFSAYLSANQSINSGVLTKIQFDTKIFDTANCYSTSTYRFTPNVAGYYDVRCNYYILSLPSTNYATLALYKNGAYTNVLLGAAGASGGNGTDLVYLNGSTDYVEMYITQDSGTAKNVGGSTNPYYTTFSASLVRAA